jgi:hypothetical protein
MSEEFSGAATGALSGAATGAGIGTAILPGWGTAIGAAGGAIIGGVKGYISGKSSKNEKKKVIEAAEKAYFDENYRGNRQLIHSTKRDLAALPTTEIGLSPQEQFRDTQLRMLDAYQRQAEGVAPSLAQTQLRQGQDQNIRSALALAASQPGGNVSSAYRNTARNIMDSNAQMNRDAAQLRMAENQKALENISNLSAQARTQDIGLATSQAQLTSQEQMQKNQLMQQYVALGFTLDQANQKAQQDLANLKVGIYQNNKSIGAQTSNALLGAGASFAASMLGSGSGGK